jgi:hypothetical protein
MPFTKEIKCDLLYILFSTTTKNPEGKLKFRNISIDPILPAALGL